MKIKMAYKIVRVQPKQCCEGVFHFQEAIKREKLNLKMRKKEIVRIKEKSTK